MAFEFEDTMVVAQLRIELIPPLPLANLLNWADFKDTNKDIREVMVSLGTVEELLEKAKAQETKDFYSKLIDKMNEVNASYVQILRV